MPNRIEQNRIEQKLHQQKIFSLVLIQLLNKIKRKQTMNIKLISLSLKTANSLKKVRGFQQVEKAGVKSWVKTTNDALGGTRHVILPSGTNVIYSHVAGTHTKKVLTKNGLFSKSFFSEHAEYDGPSKFSITTLINLKDYKVKNFIKFSDRSKPEQTSGFQFKNNLLGPLNVFNYIFK